VPLRLRFRPSQKVSSEHSHIHQLIAELLILYEHCYSLYFSTDFHFISYSVINCQLLQLFKEFPVINGHTHLTAIIRPGLPFSNYDQARPPDSNFLRVLIICNTIPTRKSFHGSVGRCIQKTTAELLTKPSAGIQRIIMSYWGLLLAYVEPGVHLNTSSAAWRPGNKSSKLFTKTKYAFDRSTMLPVAKLSLLRRY